MTTYRLSPESEAASRRASLRETLRAADRRGITLADTSARALDAYEARLCSETRVDGKISFTVQEDTYSDKADALDTVLERSAFYEIMAAQVRESVARARADAALEALLRSLDAEPTITPEAVLTDAKKGFGRAWSFSHIKRVSARGIVTSNIRDFSK